jgi:Zn finger protein HypA/HybF involved in hydrogenase expression
MNGRSREDVMWWVRLEEVLPASSSTDVEAAAAAINSRASAHARRLCREPEVVRVRLGDRVAVSDADLAHVFARLSRNGPLAAADLVVERTPTRWICPGCAMVQTLGSCCECAMPVELLAGDEMILESMQG